VIKDVFNVCGYEFEYFFDLDNKNHDLFDNKINIPRPEARTRKCAEGMLFSQGGCTQGFNTFLTALKLPAERRVLGY
jgi:hypothetical protein